MPKFWMVELGKTQLKISWEMESPAFHNPSYIYHIRLAINTIAINISILLKIAVYDS